MVRGLTAERVDLVSANVEILKIEQMAERSYARETIQVSMQQLSDEDVRLVEQFVRTS